MWERIKSIFNQETSSSKTEVVPIDYDALARKEHEQDKAKWDAANELKKKHDACYLNTTKTAFYGTYEEFGREQATNRIGAWVPTSAMMNAQLQGMQQDARFGSNPYGIAANLFGNTL